jgi:DNA-directed RNA polymerase alpha subunit
MIFAVTEREKTMTELEAKAILTRNGISTFAELEAMSNEQIANIRGLGLRGYKEILEKLGRTDGIKRTDRKDIGTI